MTTSEAGINLLINIVRRLSGATDIPALLHEIASAATEIVVADGCTLWLASKDGTLLGHEVALTKSLGLCLRREDSNGSWDIPLDAPAFAATVARDGVPRRVANIYESGYPIAGAQRFDVIYNYRTRSLMGVPILDHDHRLIGVIQSINSASDRGFDDGDEAMLSALASCAGIAITAHRRMESAKDLFRSMVHLITMAIEISFPHVADHARRLPKLVDRLAETMARRGYPGFTLDANRREVLWLSCMLHDCGLLAVHDAILQKRTRLQGVGDRIELIECRAALIQANIACAHARGHIDAHRAEQLDGFVQESLHWLQLINDGAATLTDADLARLEQIATMRFPDRDGSDTHLRLITDDEHKSLSIVDGVLTEAERAEVRRHVDHSIALLSVIPWPPELADVPMIVACHHERLDGSGYPKGLREMPLLARMVSMCDVFDGITAPRKFGRRHHSADEAVAIMESMAREGKVDGELWRFFVNNGLHLFDAPGVSDNSSYRPASIGMRPRSTVSA